MPMTIPPVSPDGVGNIWGNKAAFESLWDGVVAEVFDRLPDETVVYPGHGKDTTLGKERSSIPQWRARGWQSGQVPPR